MPNTFNPDDYLAKQGSAQSPQGIGPQNAGEPSGMQPTKTGFNPDQYLQSIPQSKGGAMIGPPDQNAPSESPHPMGPPQGSAITSMGSAFAQGAENAIVPQGMLNSVIRNSSMLSPQQQDLYDQGVANLNQNAKDHPLAKLFGTGVGVVGAGMIGSEVAAPLEKGLAALTADKVGGGALQGFGELALLSSEGGMFSVANDNPNTFEDATKSFAKGASIAGALGLTLKSASLGNDFLTIGAKNKGLKEVAMAERNIGITSEALTRAESLAAQRQAELEVTKSQLHRSQALLTSEPQINERVSTLPNKINDLMDRHINDVHGTVLQKVDAYKNAPIDPLSNYQASIDKLESAKVYTPEAISARDNAVKFVKGLMSEAYTPSGDPQNILVGSYQAPKATVDRLYSQNSRFGNLLYNRDFMANAPTEVVSALKGLQKSNRDLIAGVDPTGELSQYLDFEHSLLNAKQRDGFAQDAPEFFKQYSRDSGDPATMARWRKFERNLMPRSEVEQQFGKNEAFDAGFKPETMENPDLKQRADNIRNLINAEVSSATTDYSVLKQAKKDIPKMQANVTNLEEKAANSSYQADKLGLAKTKSLFALDQKKSMVPDNAVEALMPANLRVALHLRRNIGDSLNTMKEAGDTLIGNPALQSGLMMLAKGAVRGTETRVPSLMGLTKSKKSNP